MALPNGVTTSYAYDALNRLDVESVTRDDLATPAVEAVPLTKYDYQVQSDGKRDWLDTTDYAAGGALKISILDQ